MSASIRPITVIGGVPVGGVEDEVLTKLSAADYDADWEPLGAITHPDLATHDALGLATDTELSAHLTDAADAHDASAVSIIDTGSFFTAADVEAALQELAAGGATHPNLAAHDALGLATDTELTAHVSDATAAHAASAISFSPTGTVAATDVQGAIAEVASESGGSHPDLATHDALGLATDAEVTAAVAAHVTDAVAAHAATAIGFTPTGTIAATDVQAAIAEVASEAGGGTGGGAEELDYVQITSNVATTQTAEASAVTVVTSNPITVDGTETIVVHFFTDSAQPQPTSGVNFIAYLYDNGTSIGLIARITNNGAAGRWPMNGFRRLTPSAGSHTYSIRTTTGSGTGTILAGAGGLGTEAPAFLRITKVVGVTATGGGYVLEPVFAATTVNITIATALNAGDTFQGITLSAGQRILVKDQANEVENGIYIVGPSPARSDDWSTTSDPYGKIVSVLALTNHETMWLSQASDGDVIGTDDTFFQQLRPLPASSGTAGIASGNTSIAVTHNLPATPAAYDIHVVPTNSPTNDPGWWWISSVGATTFTINVRADPGVSTATFAWRADS